MNKHHRKTFYTVALLLSLPCLGQTTGVLTILPPPDGSSLGDIESVGDCLSGACFSSVLPNLVYASPDTVSGTPTFRSILLSDLPSTVSTDSELATHSSNSSAHHTWPLTDSEIPDDITVTSSNDDDLSDNQIGDLLDVDETGSSIGKALVSDNLGSWLPSSSPVCLSDGTNCPPSGGTGDVVGPASSTDDAIATFSGTTGKLLQNSSLIYDGSDLILPTNSQIQLPYGGTDADPSIEWPSGSGIFGEMSNSRIRFVLAGVETFDLTVCSGAIRCLNSRTNGGPGLRDIATTATTPVFLPHAGQSTSGLGGAPNIPALISNGTQSISVTSTEATIHVEQINNPSAQTCSSTGDINPGTLIISVSGASYKSVTNSDPDGCTIIISESGATSGQRLEIIIVSNVGGSITFSDTAGISESAGAFSADIYDSITYRYIADRWVEVSRSDN